MSRRRNSRPIFVFGSPRSGTSLVSRILNAHPRIGVPYESLIYSAFYPIRNAYGDLARPANSDRLIRHILSWGPITEWNPQIDIAAVRQCLSRHDFHGIFEAIVLAWTTAQRKERWGEKSPWHAFYWRFIVEGFPDASFIHVVRDVRDATLSWKCARQGPRNAYVLARKWATYVDLMEEMRRAVAPSAYYELRYECLLADPEDEVRKLCEFLNEPFDESMLEFYRDLSAYPTDRTNLVNLGKPIIQENLGKWRTELSAREIRWIESAAGVQMERLGYPLSMPRVAMDTAEKLWITIVEHPATRLMGMAQDRKGQREGLQKLWFPLTALWARE